MEEIEKLLLKPMFEMPGESSMHNSPRRQPLADLPDTTASKKKNSPDAGEALLGYVKQLPPSPHGSSQVDMADITAHSSHSLSHSTLERDTSPTPFLSLANSVILPDDVLHIKEVINNAMLHLLSTRAAIDMCHQRVISETEVGHHQNEIDTSEAIREVKAQYATMIGDTKPTYGTAMRMSEAVCSASSSEAEIIQVTRIRKAEVINAM